MTAERGGGSVDLGKYLIMEDVTVAEAVQRID